MPNASHTYKCPQCGAIVVDTADLAGCTPCGIVLFETDRLPTLNAKGLKFRKAGQVDAGEPVEYEVSYRGRPIGILASEGYGRRGFVFRASDGRTGHGTTRAAAVLNA